MNFSFRNFVYRELHALVNADLSKKLKLFMFGMLVVLVYFGTILIVTSMRQLAYNREFEANQSVVAGESVSKK